jgi:hypothetical protein
MAISRPNIGQQLINKGKSNVVKKAKKMNKGKKVGAPSKVGKQGYGARKDESIAMRVKKKRTPKQLRASANESYGKFGSKAKKKGKINRRKA